MSTVTIAKPMSDRIIVKRDDVNETTPGGIVLPCSGQEKPTRGRVVATGNGRMLDDGTRAAMEVKDGDEVVFPEYCGQEVEIEGDSYLILRESDILFVV